RPAIELLKTASIPNFSYPEPAVRSFRKLCDYAVWKREVVPPLPAISLDTEGIASRIHAATGRGEYQLGEDGAREVLTCCGFRFPAVELVRTPQEATAAADRIGFPVVMKISSPDILHKTDIGGVKTGIENGNEAAEAFTEITLNARKFMPGAFIKGVNIYETVPKGKEIILGITYDRTFGHMIMFGLGGIYVEVLKDVSFRVIPLTEKDAEEMVYEIRSVQILKGARGEKPVDFDAIFDAILRLSRLASAFPEVIELDINPLVVSDRGATALDARIILNRP
ncbi:MAG: acetate--CoA ligase family protein, partial [Nitrospiraceae bacterium]|nr:acetate--CoA ligase family protein [Nitrospiraceae bacterium]